MKAEAATDRGEGTTLIDGRYNQEKTLGQGGLAVVYQVHDAVTGTTRALKLLRPREDPNSQQKNIELFEREFHTLMQLAHPRTITVYDYGFHGADPYYTMELLDGGDLFGLAPIEWRRACSLARDVCSALSLLHSRRLVYRDLSPRNVRCTSDGQAKLIDFGAVVPMGPCKQIVGTASFCAPEALDSQPLDGRTDLYALGATLYFTLTGRRPYPARDFRHLREVWRKPPSYPSAHVAGIPKALDELVMALLHLDPARRPASAAEVMERLSGIAGLPIDEHLLVSQAYLSTPMLVGRDAHLSRVRRKLARAATGRGSAFFVTGTPGLGRSRLLNACALEGQLAGATVLRGDADDAQQGDYGVVRALCAQLLDRLPDIALHAAKPWLGTLAHVIPELLQKEAGAELTVFADPAQLRPSVQNALQRWLEELARHKLLVIAIDDMHRIDEPSAACIALLSRVTPKHALLIVATADTSTTVTHHSLSLYSEAAARLALSKLGPEETRTLLASVFGDVSSLDLIAEKLHAISVGNPRDVMRLAQHLVDKRVVRYQAGAWSLPDHIDASDLPSSIAQSMQESAGLLSPEARTLARALALSPEQQFTYEESAVLAGHCTSGRLVQLLDELATADVIKRSAERCGLAQQAWVPVLFRDPEQDRQLEQRLSEVFQMRGDRMRVGRHLLRAGREQDAVDVLVEHARTSQEQTDPDSETFAKLIEALPPDWLECYGAALGVCARDERPRRQAFDLASRMAGIVSVTGIADTTHLSGLLRQLEHDSGLDLYASLDASMEPMARLKQTFELAQQRYDASSEQERVLAPLSATRQLARALIQLSAAAVTTRNIAFLETFPSLEPYIVLSPALFVVHRMTEASRHRCSGRGEQTRQIYREILERTSQPDRAGLDESHHRHGTFGLKYGLGILEAGLGLTSSLTWASEIEPNPLYQVNAWTIRMVYHLWQGQAREADRCRRKANLLRLQNRQRQFFEDSHIPTELAAHVAAGELMRVKQSIDRIDALAKQYDGWKPILHYAIGEYHRLRGDNASALTELGASIGDDQNKIHQVWPNAVGSYVAALLELGRAEDAVACGKDYLRQARAKGYLHEAHLIQVPLSLALSATGAHVEAAAQADAALALLTDVGATGLCAAVAYRARARVAEAAGDSESADRCARLSADACGRRASLRMPPRQGTSLNPQRPEPVVLSDMTDGISSSQFMSRSAFLSTIERCQDFRERAHCCLELLMKCSHAREGFLYVAQDGQALLAARIGVREPPLELEQRAQRLLNEHREEEDGDEATEVVDTERSVPAEPELPWLGSHGEHYRPVQLHHRNRDGSVANGLAILLMDRDKNFIYPGQLATELSRFVLEDSSESVAKLDDAARR